ncbi:chromo domain-containing protein [Citrus sinensis]|nr:chromo domain-containing protein [Citrus sinensis]
MKKWADNKRRHLEFNVGDMVLVKILPSQHKSSRSLHNGLIWKYEGPFPIIKRVGNVSYKLELPSWLKLYPAFHLSCLKLNHGDTKDSNMGKSKRPPLGNTRVYDKEVETILADRVVRKKSFSPCQEYFVKWKGLPESEVAGGRW